MGLFDGIKMMVDVVKGGIESVKATDKLDKLTERSRDEFSGSITPEAEKLYQAYKTLVDAKEKEKDPNKLGEMSERVERAQVKYLTALSKDASVPKDFRDEITQALDNYARTSDMSDLFMGMVGKYMLGQVKTPEEKEAVRLMMEGVKADAKLDDLIQISQYDYADVLSAQSKKLYQAYKTLVDAQNNEKKQDKKNEMSASIEVARDKYLDALVEDAGIQEDFRAELRKAMDDFAKNGTFASMMNAFMPGEDLSEEEKAVASLLVSSGGLSVKLDNFASRSQVEYSKFLKPAQTKLYQDYKALANSQNKQKKQEKKNAMNDAVEAARDQYLKAIAADADFPKDFRDGITSTMAEYEKISAKLNAM